MYDSLVVENELDTNQENYEESNYNKNMVSMYNSIHAKIEKIS